MSGVLGLALPFFGLILLGYAVGKLVRMPPDGLAGLNIFVLYLALPALFFQLVSQTPIDQLASWSFVLATTFSTYCAFAIAFSVGALLNGGNIGEATIQGLAGSYANIGYMGPGLTLAAFGPEAAVPTALIFCFDCALVFTLTPLMMALGGSERTGFAGLAATIGRRVLLHPFILATAAGILAAVIDFVPPQPVDQLLTFLRSAAAPCALFALGVTVAARPVRRVPAELPWLVVIKLLAHPLIAYVLLGWVGDFDPVWVYTAVLMASLPTAANVFVLAQQYRCYVERSSTTVLFTTLVSVVTVTGFLYLIGTGRLPPDLFP